MAKFRNLIKLDNLNLFKYLNRNKKENESVKLSTKSLYIPYQSTTILRHSIEHPQFTKEQKNDFESICTGLFNNIESKLGITYNELKILYYPIAQKLSNTNTILTPNEIKDKEFWLTRKLTNLINDAGFYDATNDIKSVFVSTKDFERFKIWLQNSSVSKNAVNLFCIYRDSESELLKMKLYQNVPVKKDNTIENLSLIMSNSNLQKIPYTFPFGLVGVSGSGLLLSSLSSDLFGIGLSISGAAAILWSLVQIYQKNVEINFFKKQHSYSNDKLVANGWQALNCLLNLSKDEIFKNSMLTFLILSTHKSNTMPMTKLQIDSYGQNILKKISADKSEQLDEIEKIDHEKLLLNNFLFDSSPGLELLKSFGLVYNSGEGYASVSITEAKGILDRFSDNQSNLSRKNIWSHEESHLSFNQEKIEQDKIL